MSGLTWLHLSDWHQKGKDFDRSVVLDKLKDDIKNRSKIHSDLEKIDFIIFSGDLTFSGKREEFEAARENFLEPVRLAAGVEKDRVFIVPGNHDMNRDLFKYLPPDLTKPLTTHEAIIEWLDDEMGLEEILKPFKDYRHFVHQYAGDHLSPFTSHMEISINGKAIAIMGFNSALMCGRKNLNNEENDYGKIILGEPQIHDILRKYESAHIRIVVMHHPIEWFAECDRKKVQSNLKRVNHFILCGHQHVEQVEIIRGTSGQYIFIPAGSVYDRREYPNSFNYVRLDTETGKGTVYLRRWSTEESLWEPYHKTTLPNGEYGFTLPGFAGNKKPRKPNLKKKIEPPDKPETIPGQGAMFNLDNFVFNIPTMAKWGGMVGREDALLKVREQLEKGKRTAIGHTAAFQGMGGLGKTQLAVEYAYHYRNKYPKGIIWINADQEIDPQLIDLAKKAKWISPESKPSEILETAIHRLRNWSDCLIIFDNVEKYEDIENYLPIVDAQPHLLITSRKIFSKFIHIDINVLNNQHSLELLLKEANRDFTDLSQQEKEAAQSVVDQLEGLPLAIEIAGAFLSHMTGCTFNQYKTLLEANLKIALDKKKFDSSIGYERDLFNTLKLSESLLRESPLFREIIDFLAWSSSAFIGISLIATVLEKTESELIHPLNLGVTLKILQQSKDGRRYDLHRLVRKVQQEQNPITGRKDWVDQVCHRLGNWFEDRRQELNNLPEFEAEIDHLKEWLGHVENLFPVHVARLKWLQAYPPYYWGKFEETCKLIDSAFSIVIKLPDANLKLKANILTDRGAISYVKVNYNDSLSFNCQALKIRQELYGEKHFDTAMSYNNVGNAYGGLGKYMQALQSKAKALSISLKIFGQKNHFTAKFYHSMGITLLDMEKYEKAVIFFKIAIEIRLKVLNAQDPNIAKSYNYLGIALSYLNKNKEAFECFGKALYIFFNILGEQHPYTAWAYLKRGDSYRKLGDPAKGYQDCEKAVTIRLQIFGKKHPYTALAVLKLIHCLLDLKRFDEAMEKTEEWLERLPTDHVHYKEFEKLKNTINKAKRNKLSGISSKKKRR